MAVLCIYFSSDFTEMRGNTKCTPENKSILDEYFKTVTDTFFRVNYNTSNYYVLDK